jgi:exo-1,4-beta-D-glucosaminidase
VQLDVKGTLRKSPAESEALISLRNPSKQLAFFVRAEITGGKDGNEILPVIYDNNYVTVFPGETVAIHGRFRNADGMGNWLRVEGVNAPKELMPLQ